MSSSHLDFSQVKMVIKGYLKIDGEKVSYALSKL